MSANIYEGGARIDVRADIKRGREKYLSAISGSLLGGAVGDALGYPVEFLSLKRILSRYGEGGIRAYEKDRETGLAIISDDTQMTLFTAVGLLAGYTRGAMRGVMGPVESYIGMAYKDWYRCQMSAYTPEDGHWPDHRINISWLTYLPEMHARRAPGNTCLSALRADHPGSIDEPLNDSKGCGGVMRVAPVALNFRKAETREDMKRICLIAAKAAALTHGHSLGYMPAAALAHIVSRAAFGGCPYGDGLRGILRECVEILEEMFENNGYLPTFIRMLRQAETLAANESSDTDNIALLGEGWTGEEALVISVYCALRHPQDFSEAVIAAVNHSGDSDSTGAITGNIMGAWLGVEAIDRMWLRDLEMKSVIEEIAVDLCDGCRMSEFGEYYDPEWMRKYILFGNGQ